MRTPWMPSSRPGWIYVFEEKVHLPGKCKIGRTRQKIRTRAKQVTKAYGTAEPFTVASKHFVEDAAAVEWLAHRLARKWRFPRSEMFDLTPDEAAEFVLEAIALYRAPSNLSRWLRRQVTAKTTAERPAGRTRRRGSFDGLIVGGLLVATVGGVVWLRPAVPSWAPASVQRTMVTMETAWAETFGKPGNRQAGAPAWR